MRLHVSHLWKKVQEKIVDDKLFTKKKHYFDSQSKISRFQTSFIKFYRS